MSTSIYYTPTKEQLYAGMLCEKRVLDWYYWNSEICCLPETYERYCNMTQEELPKSLKEMFAWEEHILTQKEYEDLSIYEGDRRLGRGISILGEIRVKILA